MKKTIQNLINTSGDSFLENYTYKEGVAILNLTLYELDQKVNLRIKTNLLAFNVSKKSDLPYRSCFLELVKLNSVLSLNHGIYIASSNFGHFMKEKRDNLNLAYGLKASEYEFILSLSGRFKLASFVIKNLEDIEVEYVSQ